MAGRDAGFAYLDHTADLAVRAWGPTLAEAFAAAARAVTDAMVDVDRVRPTVEREFALSAPSTDLLLVEWLGALLAEKDVSGLVFSRYRIDVGESAGGATLRGSALGEPLDSARHGAKLEVKGITLLGLRVRREPEGWSAEFVADV